jgi:Rod binding domain-containing protein
VNSAALSPISAAGPAMLDPSLLRPRTGLADDQQQFAAILAQQTTQESTPEERARKAAEQLVSTALVQPIFKRLRESNNAAAPFGPNQAEKTFGSMLDTSYSERMVTSQNWGLVDQLARRMLAKLQPVTTDRGPLA